MSPIGKLGEDAPGHRSDSGWETALRGSRFGENPRQTSGAKLWTAGASTMIPEEPCEMSTTFKNKTEVCSLPRG